MNVSQLYFTREMLEIAARAAVKKAAFRCLEKIGTAALLYLTVSTIVRFLLA